MLDTVGMEDERRLWLTRLRWRLRGAWQAPAFLLATLLDALLLAELPPAGEGAGFVPGFLLAGFLNLVVVAVLGPLGGVVLRRRLRTLPPFVARDRAATVLLLGLTAGLAGAGLAHRPAVQEAERDFAAQAEAVRRHVLTQAPPRFRPYLGGADTVKQGDDLFRTCVPGPDPDRSYCVFVSTDQRPPGIQRDPDQRPNAVVSGPLNPGRRGP